MVDRRGQFGTRYLTDEAEVFTQNAWDNVEWSDELLNEAELKITEQKLTAVARDDAEQLIENAHQQWDSFYARHGNKFFMDRNWLLTEFPQLEIIKQTGSEQSFRILDVGCGVGNATIPLLRSSMNNEVFVYACDYSHQAVELLKDSVQQWADRCKVFHWDVTKELDPAQIALQSLDAIVCIYVLSAIPAKLHAKVIGNLVRLLKPGGVLLLKDYAKFDMTQLRFKKNRLIDENFYRRGDGTLVYYFTQNELHDLLTANGLQKINNVLDRRLIVNRAKCIKMYRMLIALTMQKGLYYASAEVLRLAIGKLKNVRNAVQQSEYPNKKHLMRMCCQTLRNKKLLDEVIELSEVTKLLRSTPINDDRCLLYVLLYEYIFGNGLKRAASYLSKSIRSVSSVINQRVEALKSDGKFAEQIEESVKMPRYVRVNTLKWTVEEAVEALMKEGWSVKKGVPGNCDSWFLDSIKALADDEVLIDVDIYYLLVFNGNADLHDYWMITDGYLLFQDKSSCLASQILNPKAGSHVIDVCAAPGMKTSHLSALLNNEGKIWAFDRDEVRVKSMREMIRKTGATNIVVNCNDFLRVDVSEERFNEIRYALVDPPCSGTGMIKRMDKFIDDRQEKDHNRLRSLANLQAMLLKHTMRLPNVKRIVYSTCSISEEENEQVIQEVLNDSEMNKIFTLKTAMKSWRQRGKADYPFHQKCLRATPEANLTNGFFIALFIRRKSDSSAEIA